MPVTKKVQAAVTTQSSVKHSKTGADITKTKIDKLVEVPEACANVGVQAQRTINLGEYNNVKLGVSIHHPCAPTPEAIQSCYEFCVGWVDEKMEALCKDHNPVESD